MNSPPQFTSCPAAGGRAERRSGGFSKTPRTRRASSRAGSRRAGRTICAIMSACPSRTGEGGGGGGGAASCHNRGGVPAAHRDWGRFGRGLRRGGPEVPPRHFVVPGARAPENADVVIPPTLGGPR